MTWREGLHAPGGTTANMQWGFHGPDQIVQPREGVEVRVRREARVRVRCGEGVAVLVRRGVLRATFLEQVRWG